MKTTQAVKSTLRVLSKPVLMLGLCRGGSFMSAVALSTLRVLSKPVVSLSLCRGGSFMSAVASSSHGCLPSCSEGDVVVLRWWDACKLLQRGRDVT